MMSLLQGWSLDDNDLKDITEDLKTLDQTEFTSIAKKVSGLLNGAGDVQQLLQSLGEGGTDGVQNMLQGLGGMDMLSQLMSKVSK
jgi:hypothetical protein